MSKNTGLNYDANATLTLNQVSGGRYLAGTCIAVRSGGNKGQPGNVYGYAPAIGVCPEGTADRYRTKAGRVQSAYMVLPDEDGHIVLFKSRDKARDEAHDILQRMDNAKVATFSPEQKQALEVIRTTHASIRQLNNKLATLREYEADTSVLDGEILLLESKISTLRTTHFPSS